MNVLETLESISHYPIPDVVILTACTERGIDASIDVDEDVAQERSYCLAKADCYRWLYFAPSSISENGVSFSMSQEEKRNYRMLANDLYRKFKVQPIPSIFGYKGSNF